MVGRSAAGVVTGATNAGRRRVSIVVVVTAPTNPLESSALDRAIARLDAELPSVVKRDLIPAAEIGDLLLDLRLLLVEAGTERVGEPVLP